MKTSKQTRRVPATSTKKPAAPAARAEARADAPIPFVPTPKVAELDPVPVYVGPIAPLTKVFSSDERPSPAHVEAERVVLSKDLGTGQSLAELVGLALADDDIGKDLCGSFLQQLDAELEVVIAAANSDEGTAAAIANMLGGIQRRAAGVLELQRRIDRARNDDPTVVALPEPVQVVDALLALPGVVRAGSSPLSTLQRMLAAIGCNVYRSTEERDREDLEEFGKRAQRSRNFRFTPPWRREGAEEIYAIVPHDTTDEERLEQFPGFVVVALAIREGYNHLARHEWHRAVVGELRVRLALASVEQKGAA